MNDDATPTPPAEQPGLEASAAPELVVAIPPRHEGQAPIELVVEEEDLADRLRQLVKSGLRRDDLNRAMAAVERQREELDFAAQQLEFDPVGFLREYRRRATSAPDDPTPSPTGPSLPPRRSLARRVR